MGIVTIYGKFGDVESRRGREEETQSHLNREPMGRLARAYLLSLGLTKMPCSRLLKGYQV